MQLSSRHALAVALMAPCLALACQRVPAEDAPGEWRQWRGPFGLGVSNEVNLPVKWASDGNGVRWKTAIPGTGNSSPIVSRGRIFLTSALHNPETKRADRIALSFDLTNGQLLWQTVVFDGPKGKKHWTNTHAGPTAASDGESIFVSFDGQLVSLDFDGRIRWQKEVDSDYYRFSRYGAASSPVVSNGLVVLMQDREYGDTADPGWLAVFSKTTGEEMWRQEWTDTCCAYTTPLVVQIGRQSQVLNYTSSGVIAFDLQTGERLWQAENQTIQPIPSPVIMGDLLCLAGGMHSKETTVHRLRHDGTQTTPELLWSTLRMVPNMVSPMFYRGRLFTVSDRGVLTAFDPSTGKVRWKGRLGLGGFYRPSLVGGDDKIYATNEKGLTAVLSATAEKFQLLAKNDLGEGTNASPAIAQPCLLIRGSDHLFCIDNSAGDA